MQTSNSSINRKDDSETIINDFKDIIYCKAEGNYTKIYSQNKSILVTNVLKVMNLFSFLMYCVLDDIKFCRFCSLRVLNQGNTKYHFY
jgi:hypothetical protein